MALSVLLSLSLLASVLTIIESVSPGRVAELTTDQYFELDREVKTFFEESYHDLDGKNASYDEQLFRSIRSIRHTIVINHNEFRYTNDEYKRQSMGSSVDKSKCKQQLFLLAKLAEKVNEEQQSIQSSNTPLSIVNFLESSARAESGVLNGNFVWLGSFSSCTRAKIFGQTIESFLGDAIVGRAKLAGPSKDVVPDIEGRYCVAHLRAKSWPKWDIYFEDRITIRKGICLPLTCHTAIFEEDQEIQKLVDYISRQNLNPPFNQDKRYETSSLYCLPDDDSPFRQWDLGAKMFLAFIGFWTVLTVWLNIKYYRRIETMQKLRETIDIRMIIETKQRSLSDHDSDEKEGQQRCDANKKMVSSSASNECSKPAEATSEKTQSQPREASGRNNPNKNLLQASARKSNKQFTKSSSTTSDKTLVEEKTLKAAKENSAEDEISLSATSAQSSLANTPLPSDVEETDAEFIKMLRGDRKKSISKTKSQKRRTTSNANFVYDELNNSSDKSLDLAHAFSLEANFKFLVSPRSEAAFTEKDVKQKKQRTGSQAGMIDQVHRGSQQYMNDKLIKDLKEQDYDVSIVSRSEVSDHGKSAFSKRRITIEVLDGLKVVATSYIIFGHTLMFFYGCVNDLRFASERMLDFTMMASINTLQVVGLFYIITGCLFTYLSFSRTKLKQLMSPAFWLKVIIGRYFRLLPAYMLVFWFSRHVATHFGSGRDWYDYRTDVEHPRGYCGQESWWTMWTMSAADVKIPLDCVPQAWYLSDDFRTLMVLPFYVYLLARSAPLGYGAIFATIVYSNMKLVAVLREANVDYKILLAWQPHVYSLMADRLHEVYTNFSVRISTYLLGVIIGHILYLYEINNIKEIPKVLQAIGMKVALFGGIITYFGAAIIANPYVNQFLPAAESVTSNTVVLLVPLFKLTMESCLSILVLLLVTGNGSPLVRYILSSSAMKILSNISYAVFLTHVEVMYKLPGAKFESNYWYLFTYSIFFIATSHVVAFFLHLLYEMPINNIIRHVFRKLFGAVRS